MDSYDKAIDAVKSLSPENFSNFRVSNHHSEFLSGSLYLVEFENPDKPDKKYHNFVYIEGPVLEVCKNQALLNELVSKKSKKTRFELVLDNLGGVAGIIGLIITISIIWFVVNYPGKDVPQVLSTALTAILGFYFGSKVNKT